MPIKYIHSVFVSNDSRLRAGWRLIIQILLTLLFLIPLQLLGAWIGGRNIQILTWGVAITLSVWVTGWIMDKRPIRDFGLKLDMQWWRDCAVGFFMAALVMSLVVLCQWLMGWIEFTGFGWNRSSDQHYMIILSGYLVTMAMVGFYEELWMRGYQLKNLSEGFFFANNQFAAVCVAVAISSLIFGALHLGNPHATVFGAIVIVLAGVMLALPYVLTGQLGMSVGIHFAWNFIQGGVYGFPVSGMRFRQSILQFEHTGPASWTGGSFGPEGGLLGIFGVMALLIAVLVWHRIKGSGLKISASLLSPPLSGNS
ncbi:MAG: CPBP family intramembrane glutamic endopeptidase [Balneolales bacterium]